jgi:hypothetical protein
MAPAQPTRPAMIPHFAASKAGAFTETAMLLECTRVSPTSARLPHPIMRMQIVKNRKLERVMSHLG